MNEVALLSLLSVVPANLLAQTESRLPLQSLELLVESERAFSRTSVAKGMRPAFLEYLADGAIIFAPTPVEGKVWWKAQEHSEAVLSWQPEFADMAAAGDLGYTTGPWELRAAQDSAPARWGHYVSVWSSDSLGTWRVVIDAGISHGPPAHGAVGLTFPSSGGSHGSGTHPNLAVRTTEAALLATDRAFSDATATSGIVESAAAYLAPEARVYRDGLMPIVGRDNARAALAVDGVTRLRWEPSAAVMARSGDLGFTYGVAEIHPGEVVQRRWRSASYLRIWRQRGGSWKVVLDRVTAIRTEGGG